MYSIYTTLNCCLYGEQIHWNLNKFKTQFGQFCRLSHKIQQKSPAEKDLNCIRKENTELSEKVKDKELVILNLANEYSQIKNVILTLQKNLKETQHKQDNVIYED